MLLGNKELNIVQNYQLREFVVYMHEKGQFWPRQGLTNIGQSEGIRIERGMEISGQFEMKKIEMIDRKDYCKPSREYSYTKCIQDFIGRKTNCRINWSLGTSEQDLCDDDINLGATDKWINADKYPDDIKENRNAD